MKKLYLIILIIPITINAQQKQKTEIQNYWYKQARLDLKNLHLEKAFSSSKFSYDVFPESDKGKKSLKLFDSLKTILRNKLTSDMYGDWKLKIFNRVKTESDRKYYERLGRFLRIKKDSIFYYSNRRNLRSNKPTLSFKINFCELMNYFPSYSDIIHLNNEIWHYRIDSTKNRLIILDYGKLDNGKKNRTGNISHPSGYTYKRLK